MRVDVVTAVHDAYARFLPAAWDSLRAQDRGDWTWFVQIDGPGAGVRAALAACGAATDPRVRIDAHTERLGAANTRNIALGRGDAELVQNLDADDELEPSALRQLSTAIAERPATGFAVGHARDLLPDGSLQPRTLPLPDGVLRPGSLLAAWTEHGTTRPPVHPAGVLWRRSLLTRLGGWSALHGMEDTAVLMAASTHATGVLVAEPTLRYRKHPQQQSHRTRDFAGGGASDDAGPTTSRIAGRRSAGMTDLVFGGRRPHRDGPLIMAIVNRTPDSFYDAGATYAADAALRAVDAAVAAGADIVDIGGVKAGPGDDVSSAQEIDRVVPVIAAVRARFPELIISADTWRADVGRRACDAGADLLNDTWAGADPELATVAAEYGAGYVCSHTGGLAPRTRPHRVRYRDVVAEVLAETTAHAERLVASGVPRGGILIDPTHDFGKNTWHGLQLLDRAGELTAGEWPVLMALSNKDFVGEVLDVGVRERLPGTLAATALAAMAGVAVFRAHEVAETRRVLDVALGPE